MMLSQISQMTDSLYGNESARVMPAKGVRPRSDKREREVEREAEYSVEGSMDRRSDDMHVDHNGCWPLGQLGYFES